MVRKLQKKFHGTPPPVVGHSLLRDPSTQVRENPIDRSPADADLAGNLCRPHASVTQLAYPVSLGPGSWRSALVLAFGPGLGNALSLTLQGQLPLNWAMLPGSRSACR